MKKYVVVDYYEEPVVVGYADSMKEAKELESTWHEDTDGECITEILTTEG